MRDKMLVYLFILLQYMTYGINMHVSFFVTVKNLRSMNPFLLCFIGTKDLFLTHREKSKSVSNIFLQDDILQPHRLYFSFTFFYKYKK